MFMERVKYWLPWILTVFSALIAIAQYIPQFTEYRMNYLVETDNVNVPTPDYFSVDVSVDGDPINDFEDSSFGTLTIWNAGRSTLLGNQFRAPINVQFKDCLIYRHKLIAENSLGANDITFNWQTFVGNQPSFSFEFENFDPGEAFKLAWVGNCGEDDVSFQVTSPIIRAVEKPYRFELYSIWAFIIIFGTIVSFRIGKLSKVGFAPLGYIKISIFGVLVVLLSLAILFGILWLVSPLVAYPLTEF